MSGATSMTHETPLPADSAFRSVEQRRWAIHFGVWCFLATVTMLFAAFSSSYIVRQAGTDWDPTPLPRVLWFNTALLVVSSVALEFARRAAVRQKLAAARTSLIATVILGVAFVIGQFGAWRDLVAGGYYLPSSPHASFFYILTALHAAHLAAAMVLLLYITRRISVAERRGDREDMPFLLGVGSTFWHFFGALWIYLFAMLALV
jgi:cytochrome c oxidase subunit 3